MNDYLLINIGDELLNDAAASRVRSVGEPFVHLHNVPLLWLQAAQPALLNGLTKL